MGGRRSLAADPTGDYMVSLIQTRLGTNAPAHIPMPTPMLLLSGARTRIRSRYVLSPSP